MAGTLAKLSRIRTDLESAKTIPDIIDVRDKSAAVITYAKAIGLKVEIVNVAVENKLRAERKAGALLAGMDGKGSHGGKRRSSSIVELETLGVTKKQSHRWQKLAGITDADFDSFVAQANESKTELTTDSVMRQWAAISKPSNGKSLRESDTLAAALERLHSAMSRIYDVWPERHRAALETKLRDYADEIKETGGLQL